MPFQFKKASCVAIGTFNIYIIQPGWLIQVGILPGVTEIAIAANLTRPGFRLSSPQMQTTWFVSPGKLAIEALSEHQPCGAQMAAVLNKLLYTPVSALGNNVFYQAPRDTFETFPAFEACADLAVVPEGYKKTKHVFTASVERDGRTFNLQVTVGPETVDLTGNAHIQLPEGGTTEKAAAFAASFDDDVRTLTDLFDEVLGVRIDNVTSH